MSVTYLKLPLVTLIKVYGLALCWESVSGIAWPSRSLTLVHVLQRKKERVLNASCYMRYSTQKFYYNSSDLVGGENYGEF